MKRKCKKCGQKVTVANRAVEYYDGTVKCDDCAEWTPIDGSGILDIAD